MSTATCRPAASTRSCRSNIIHFIETADAPLPTGHYSQAVVANGFVFVAGILPLVPRQSERTIPAGVVDQAEQAFANLSAILTEAGSDLQHMVSVQIFVSDIESWKPINQIYTRILGAHKPARTIIPCSPLHHGVALELNAVAVTL